MLKVTKILAIILIAMMVIMACTPVVFAAGGAQEGDKSGQQQDKSGQQDTGTKGPTAADIAGQISANTSGAETAASGLTYIASRVLGLIQIASAIAAVVLVAVFGFKFIMASPEGKADYAKSFIPLIVGVVVVFSATSLAKLIFGLVKSKDQ